MQKKTVKLGAKKVTPKQAAKVRQKAGESNAGKYQNVKAKDFAGPDGTFPINTTERAKSALKLAHNAGNPNSIKEKVYARYPFLRPTGGKKK